MSSRPIVIAILTSILCLSPVAHAGKLRELLEQKRENNRNAEKQAQQASDQQSLQDIRYGNDRKQTYDIYLPADHAQPGHPVIFMVHGGGWRYGDKDVSRVVENKVSRWVGKGFIFISVNYPMLPDTNVQAQEASIIKALAHAQQHATEWGGDPGKFILMGHSAGAHLVDLLNAQPESAISVGAKPWLATVSLDTATLDVADTMNKRHLRLYDNAFGQDASYWASLSPIAHISADSPPLLAICSTKRADQPCTQATSYQAAATKLGRRVDILPQPLSHGDINSQLGLDSDYTRQVERFMSSVDTKVAALLAQ